MELVSIFTLTVLLFLPSAIAYYRGVAYRHQILVLNICLGWTVLGWFGLALYTFLAPPIAGSPVL